MYCADRDDETCFVIMENIILKYGVVEVMAMDFKVRLRFSSMGKKIFFRDRCATFNARLLKKILFYF